LAGFYKSDDGMPLGYHPRQGFAFTPSDNQSVQDAPPTYLCSKRSLQERRHRRDESMNSHHTKFIRREGAPPTSKVF